ncbi:NAD-dependent epimerase/dehydratase family protein [Chitinophaga japonensis]|uniref:Nucleoside-diphosphate-sugar epimerase n=1 Tax=Chitinophaga japonensis TaxID=104662 RepID=A0A562TBV8_CHIJA|nr:NAD-dependent epimerase/dehydratase family protein [Chitinophaga japonensis]TWI91041.1 nucleoside-diphosphate-sugar epimerase [Chitinophaga japonensis]
MQTSLKKVFITGATGYIGGSVAAHLAHNGYVVTGLVRKAADISRLKALGIRAVQGDLDNVSVITEQAQAADAIINAASADNPYVVATLLAALAGTGKTLIHTSGSSIAGDKAAGEHGPQTRYSVIPTEPLLEKAGRVAIDRTVMGATEQGLRSIVICPTMIYGDGLGLKKDSIQVPLLRQAARQYQAGVFIGKGANVWSNVHIRDLAQLYQLALEKAPAGAFYYAENGEAAIFDIAEVISRLPGFNGKTRSLSMDEAIALWGAEGAHFGLGSNSYVSAERAREELGWQPAERDILQHVQ